MTVSTWGPAGQLVTVGAHEVTVMREVVWTVEVVYWVEELEFAEFVGMPEDGPISVLEAVGPISVLEAVEVAFAELLGTPEDGPMGPVEPVAVAVEFAELLGTPEDGPAVAVAETQAQAEFKAATTPSQALSASGIGLGRTCVFNGKFKQNARPTTGAAMNAERQGSWIHCCAETVLEASKIRPTLCASVENIMKVVVKCW